jgi:transcriptional regulator with XRE-family HTH domain
VNDLEERADHLVRGSRELVQELVQARKDQGLTQEQLAERVGCPVKAVQEFESYWFDPALSQIRLYALAVNVEVTFATRRLPEEKK